MDENEIYYDEIIAPKLMEVAEECRKKGMRMLATVQFNKDSCGHTFGASVDDPLISVEMIDWAMRSSGNADQLIMAMREHAKKHGHKSVFLHLLEKSCETS